MKVKEFIQYSAISSKFMAFPFYLNIIYIVKLIANWRKVPYNLTLLLGGYS